MTQASVNGWKDGSWPSLENAAKVAVVLEVSTDYLAGLVDDPAAAAPALEPDELVVLEAFRALRRKGLSGPQVAFLIENARMADFPDADAVAGRLEASPGVSLGAQQIPEPESAVRRPDPDHEQPEPDRRPRRVR